MRTLTQITVRTVDDLSEIVHDFVDAAVDADLIFDHNCAKVHVVGNDRLKVRDLKTREYKSELEERVIGYSEEISYIVFGELCCKEIFRFIQATDLR